ncbi:hypothetical protein C8Q80DRAFT_1184818 [Daedaleopsis nitida]|nr:hypothetical protein C8Q80DRAFT_1184818 [Daedaleopsis nitida]
MESKVQRIPSHRNIQRPGIMEPRIHVETRYIPPAEMAVPALAVQITRLVDTYMLWVGTTDVEEKDVHNAPSQGCLGRDWACAMPSKDTVSSAVLTLIVRQLNFCTVAHLRWPWLKSSIPGAATSLYRSSSSDAALSMSQRLARRFKKQIFLSIDMPPSLGSTGQEGKLLLAIERGVGDILRSYERPAM